MERPDGEVVWTRLSVAMVRGLADEPLYFVVQFQDVTARKEAEAELGRYAAELAELARVDPVTGLPNYRQFHYLLNHELQRARRHEQPWSVVLFDIDGLQAISEVDRQRADRALALAGHAISDACRGSDHAARIGSDQFALILPNTDSTQAQVTARRVAAAVENAGVATLSHGEATWPHDGDSVELLLLRADMSLEAGKRTASGCEPATAVHSAVLACPTDAVQELVGVAHQFLGMDVAFLARINDVEHTLHAVSGRIGVIRIQRR